MPNVTRDLKVTYGATVIGGSTDYLIVDTPFRLHLTPTDGEFECEVLLALDTEAAFLTAEGTLMTAFNTPRLRLRIELGSAERYDFDPADSTGFDHEASCEKLPSIESTGQSSRYKILIAFKRQATLVNADGRSRSTTEITMGPSRIRQVVFSGAYTAVGTSNAYTMYTAGVATFTSGQLSTLLNGLTFNKVLDRAVLNDTNKQLEFEQVFKEVVANEAVGTLDLAYLYDQQLSVVRTDMTQESGEAGINPPQELTVSYDVSVDKETSTDLKGLWEGTIFPHLLSQCRGLSSGGTVIAVEVSPVFSVSENKISATFRALAYLSNLVMLDVEVEDIFESGMSDADVWCDVPYAKDVWPGPPQHVRVVTVMRVSRGGTGGSRVAAGAGLGVLGLGGGVVNGIFGGGSGSSYDGHQPTSDHRTPGNFIERTKQRKKRVAYSGARGSAKVKLIAEFEQRTYFRAEKPPL